MSNLSVDRHSQLPNKNREAETGSGYIIVLLLANFTSLCGGVHALWVWPDTARLVIPVENCVGTFVDEAGNKEQLVDVPLKGFPYEIALGQRYRSDLVWIAAVNLFVASLYYYKKYFNGEKLRQATKSTTA